jgi:hypothetical protein
MSEQTIALKASLRKISSALAARLETWLRQQRQNSERASWLFPPLLLLFTLVVWSPSLLYGLDMSNRDDYFHLTSMARQHSLSDIISWFKYGYWAYNHFEYRPLTRFSLLLTYLIFGPRLWAFHLTNVLFHFGCAWLVGAILVQSGLGKGPARLAAAVWVVFPQGVMAVRWINGRQDMQCALLILLAVWGFARWLNGKSFWYLVGVAFALQLAVFTKEPGFFAPLFLGVAALLLPGRRPLYLRMAAVVGIGLPLFPALVMQLRTSPAGRFASYAPWQINRHNLPTFCRLLLCPSAYELFALLGKLGWLVLFNINRNRWAVEQITFWVGLVILLRKYPRLLLLAVAWKIIFWLPVAKLYFNPAFTHYRYLPNIGSAWLIGPAAWEMALWAFSRLRPYLRLLARGALIAAALATLLIYYWAQLGLGLLTWSRWQAGEPKSPPQLWKELVCKRSHAFWIEESSAYPPCPPEEYFSRQKAAKNRR